MRPRLTRPVPSRARDIGSGTLLTDASRLRRCAPVAVMVITSVRANKPSVTALAVALPPRSTLLSSVQPTAQPGLLKVLPLSRYDLALTLAEPLATLPVNCVSQLDAPTGVVKPVPVTVTVKVPPVLLERSKAARSM